MIKEHHELKTFVPRDGTRPYQYCRKCLLIPKIGEEDRQDCPGWIKGKQRSDVGEQ